MPEATYVNELIRVGAVFGDGKRVKPLWFVWHGRRIPVTGITFTWSSKQGAADIHHFSVTDEAGNLYELCYHARQLLWTLHQIEANE